MASIGATLKHGTLHTLMLTPSFAMGGAFFGYAYSKLADLPTSQAVKAYTVYAAVSVTLVRFLDYTIENKATRCVAIITASSFSTLVGIKELTRRGLISDNLKYILLAAMVIHNLFQIMIFLSPKQQPPATKKAPTLT